MDQSHGARRACRFAVVAVLLWFAALLPTAAFAQASVYCPTLSATVAQGGTVDIDVSNCDSVFDFGVGTPAAGYGASHGTVTLDPAVGGTQFAHYAHNGDSATSDVFHLEDDEGGDIQVNVTITAAASPITISPGSLPAMTAGVAFSQTLTSSGGTAPYAYSVSAGVLPTGLTLSSAGVISGTPTQRGTYNFTVTSQDSAAATGTKGYTGTVANPTLTLTTPSGTAVQSAPFSQTLATTGGVAPYTYALETGTLPSGITLASTGVVSGTTNAAAGSYPVTVRVTDSSTGPGSYFEVENYTLTVSPPPSVSIAVSPASVSEDGATNFTFTVTRSLNLSSATVVNITTTGTATAGTDYTGNVATVTIPAGATTATITIDPTVDTSVEADETVTLIVAAGSGYTVGAPASATGTILNDDVPTATIAVSPASVAEDGAPNLVYTVTLSQPASSSTSVNFSIGGTATIGSDYATIASPVIIPAGNTTGTITVNPTADATVEANETVTLTLGAGAGYTVGVPNSATGTILNDDLPNLTINDVTANEGNAGTTNFTFTVSLSAPAGPGGVTFDIATANGTATSGVDYVASSLTSQTIPAGSSTYTFTVQANGDTLNEPTETFFVNVTNVTNAVVVDGQGVGTITNDDAVPGLSINDVTVVEGNAGTVNAVFTVTLDAASGQTVTVNYATADNTATAPADYTSGSGTLTFSPGQTTRTITVPVIGETVPEANESFFVNLSGVTNASVTDGQGVGTITNDDVPVTVSPATVPNATVGVAYSQTLTASGGTSPYAFAVTAGALPAGLTLSSTGTLSGTPTAGGTFNFTVTATDSSTAPGPYSGAQSYVLTVAAPTITLTPTTLPGGTRGTPYSQTITASGGIAPYTFSVTAGALPAGMTLAIDGTLSGTPTQFGTFNFTVTANDSSTGAGAPYSGSRAYTWTLSDAPPVASDSSATIAFNASATPVTLALSGGAPTSLSITSAATHGTASVSGTTISYQPNAGYAGSDSFTYTATNGGGTSAPAAVSITVSDPTISVAAGGSLNATVGAAYSVTFTWSGGTAPYSGYQVTGLPAGLSITGSTANSVTVSGTPTQAGSASITAQATDSSTGNGPFTASQAFTLNVAPPALTLAPAAGTLTAAYGSAYSQTFTAGGGIGPYTYAVTGSLPPGVTLSGATLSGTPTAPGSYAFSITATDTGSTGTGAPFSVTQGYTLQVAAPTITITPATLPNGTAGTAYSQTLVASGGVAPYTFAVTSGALPAGLTLASSGALSGTPTASGTFNFTARAADANGQAGTRIYTLTIAAPTLTLSPATIPSATAGTAYSQVFTVSGGIAPYTASLVGTLPTGLAFNTATRTLSGTPTQSGSFAFDIVVTDSTSGTPGTVTQHYTLTVAAPTLTLTPSTVPAGTAGVAYSQTFTASGGIAPYQYAIASGALPAGLTLNGSTGVLAGTPTVAGTFNFSVRATDSTTGTPASVTTAYTLTLSAPVITITPATLPAGVQQTAYTQTLTASGGTAPYTFAVTAGTLPSGLALASNGALTGTPTADGAYAFTVTATDALGFTATRAYAVTVAPRPDPSRDAEVRGLLDAQAQATRRFATAQIDNFHARLETLHGGGRTGGMQNGLTFIDSDRCNDNPRSDDACIRARADRAGIGASDTGSGGDGAMSSAPSADAPSRTGFWIGGALRSGSTDARAGSAGLDFETDGVSAGADWRISDAFAFGAGVGYGRDATDVGGHDTRAKGTSYALAAYASYHPGRTFFLDGLLGYQRLSFDLRRYVTVNGATVTGSRDGTQWFGSLSAGADLTRGGWQITPYARVDVSRATLDAYTERGDALYALAFGEQSVDGTTGDVGVRFGTRRATAWGAFSPLLRVEYQHDFQGDGTASMRYADLATGPLYTARVLGFDRSRFMLGAGGTWTLHDDFSIRLEYRGVFGTSGDRDNGLQLNFQKSY